MQAVDTPCHVMYRQLRIMPEIQIGCNLEAKIIFYLVSCSARLRPCFFIFTSLLARLLTVVV